MTLWCSGDGAWVCGEYMFILSSLTCCYYFSTTFTQDFYCHNPFEWLATSKSQCQTAKQNDFNHIYSKWSSCWSSFKFFTVFSVSKIFCVNQQHTLPHCFSEIFICIPCSILQMEGLVPDMRMDYLKPELESEAGSRLSTLILNQFIALVPQPCSMRSPDLPSTSLASNRWVIMSCYVCKIKCKPYFYPI